MRFDRKFVPMVSLVVCCLVGENPVQAWLNSDEVIVAPGMSAARPVVPDNLLGVAPPLAGDGSEAPSAVSQWLAEVGVAVPTRQPLQAETAITPGGLIGTNFPISNNQDAVSRLESLDAASVAFSPLQGEYLVVWHAFDRVTNTNIYGQRVSWTGVLVGEPIVICNMPGVQAVPSVVFDPTRAVYWVVWTDFRDGSADVIARRVSGAGALLGAEIVVNTDAPDAFAARVACGGGICAVAWATDPHDGNAHILIRSYNAVTLAPNVPGLLLSEPVGQATEPDICYNGDDGRFLVVWHEWRGASRSDVWSYQLNANMSAHEKKAICSAVNDQQKARVAYSHGAGRYLVVWEDARSGTTWDVYGQRLERGGAFAGGAMAIFAGPYFDRMPAVAGHGSATSEFLVSFQRDVSGAGQFEIYASRVSGAGAVGSAFVVREWYNVRTRSAIAYRDGTDDYLVAFTDDPFMTQADIAAQVARGSGVLAGGMISISRGRKGQEAPTVAHNVLRNEYLALWADYRDLHDYDIFYRRVSAGGAAVPPEFILASTAALYGEPAVAHNSVSDGYLVVWQEVTSQNTGFEICGRRLSGALEPLGSQIVVSRDTAAHNEGHPRIAYNPVSGEYLAVWHAFTGGGWRIWGQRLSAAGALLGGNFTISDGLGTAQSPRVAVNRQRNQYVVIWQDARSTRLDVYAQLLGAGGGLIGPNYAITEATGNKNRCDIAYSQSHDEYLVAWGDTRTGGNDVWAQRLDGTGALLGNPFPVAAGAVGESSPVVGYDHLSHEFLVAYWVFNQSTDYDVWARRVPCVGLPSVPAFPLSGALEVQNRCELAHNDSTTEFMVVWQDFRNGSYDIFGQRWMKLPRSRLHRGLGGNEVAP
jgi:hypothetical protein